VHWLRAEPTVPDCGITLLGRDRFRAGHRPARGRLLPAEMTARRLGRTRPEDVQGRSVTTRAQGRRRPRRGGRDD